MAQLVPEPVLLITEASLPSNLLSLDLLPLNSVQRFLVLVSEQFSGLLLAEVSADAAELPSDSGSDPASQSLRSRPYQIGITFHPEAIATFLRTLGTVLPQGSQLLDQVTQVQIHANDATWQSEFTLRIVEVLAATSALVERSAAADAIACAPLLEAALRQQVEQERLMNQVVIQIRQSLELPIILETAVQQIRHILQADRVVIFQFAIEHSSVTDGNGNRSETSPASGAIGGVGQITHEARATDDIPCVLNQTETDHCFVHIPDCWKKYHRGVIQAVEDIETVYADMPCLVERLRQAEVRAKLVIPIAVQNSLWGLLIVHQCSATRHWQDSEKNFMKQIAEHLAIAIHQTQLYAQLHQQARSLEQRVIERTQALYDAMSAAQSASQAKTEFLAAMSHELRTPLTCIIGMSNTLIRAAADPTGANLISPQRQHTYLSMIHNSGEHLLALINDILDLSQVDAGKTILDSREFSLTQIAIESLDMLRDRARQQAVELILDLNLDRQSETTVPEARCDRLTADPRRIRQILLNLLSNAIKFTASGGQVTLRLWQENNGAVFQIEDTGIGIADHQFPLLFKKFQQLDMSYQRGYEGSGLGLAITKQLVDLHGGWIEVDSMVNVGSTFTVWIPDKLPDDGREKQRDRDTNSIPPERNGRIVLIEDDEDTASLICDLLTAAGYQVIWMLKGATITQQIEILQPLILLINIYLPWINGYEVLQNLRQNQLTANLRILALTPQQLPNHGTYWLQLGVDDSITLPIAQPEQLLDKVARLVQADGVAELQQNS